MQKYVLNQNRLTPLQLKFARPLQPYKPSQNSNITIQLFLYTYQINCTQSSSFIHVVNLSDVNFQYKKTDM